MAAAQAQHDAFAATLRDHRIRVHYYGELFAQTLAIPQARSYVMDRAFDPWRHGPLAVDALLAALDGRRKCRKAHRRASQRPPPRRFGGEAAALPAGGIRVHDSKDRTGPVLSFTNHEWRVFVTGTRKGESDLPG